MEREHLIRVSLDKLLGLFKGQCQQVIFGDEEHLYDSLEEMEGQHSRPLRCFVVQGTMPHTEIVIRGSQTVPLAVQRSTLWVMERNPKSDLLFLSIKDFLHTRRSLSRIALRRLLLILGGVALVICLFSKTLLGMNRSRSDLVYNIAVLASMGLLVVGALMNSKQVSYVTLRSRSKSESFWERNRNSILMTVIGTAIGIVGTLVTTWLKNVWGK